MNIFLTGATGYVGNGIAQALQRADHEVVGLTRSDAGVARLQAQGIRPLQGDLTDLELIAQAACEADAVIHAASSNNADTPKVDTQAVETILSALAGSRKPFIYTSGSWVVGSQPEGLVADEEQPPAPPMIVAWRPMLEQRIRAATE